MDGMIILDVVNPNPRVHGPKTMPIGISIGMGVRVIADNDDVCWISLSDNSVWKSPDDFQTTVDKINGLYRHL